MMELRPQQVLFEDAIRREFNKGHRKVLAVATTGFGKGFVCGDMAAKSLAKGNRVLIVTNRRAIVYQLKESCESRNLWSGIMMGDEDRDDRAPIQVASIRTLQRRGLTGLDPGFIILDEAHQENAAYRTLINETYPDVRVLGLSATPVGKGGTQLNAFDSIVEPVKNSEVIKTGFLLNVHPYLAPSEPDLGGLNLKSASKTEVGRRVDACTVYGDVFKEWEPFSHMQTIVVLPSRAVCNTFHEHCVERGIRAAVVDGTTNKQKRKETFDKYKNQEVDMLLGVDVVREGLDLPAAQCLIDLQPTHQFRVYWQKIGRVKRMYPGQKSAVVIDFAGNLWRHMIHPDQDPPWDELAKNKTIEETIKKKEGALCPKCGSNNFFGPVDGLYRCEDCEHAWEMRKPWVCPHCAQALSPGQKRIGGKCPNCGETVTTKPTRTIKFEDGSIRTVSAEEVRQRKRKKKVSKQIAWKRLIFMALHTGRPYGWCHTMFKKEYGHYPRRGMPFWTGDINDARRPVEAVFPGLQKKKRRRR